MKILANYHTHTLLCNHAEGHVEDYVKKAISVDFSELGMSDHGFVPLSPSDLPITFRYFFTSYMSEDDFYNDYLIKIKEAQIKYKDEIKIYAGLECEYFYNQEAHYKKLLEHLDYLVLGQHYVYHNGKYLSTYLDLNSDNILSYANNISDALDSGYFKILAHPDLFMLGYSDSQYQMPIFDKRAKEASKIIIEACVRNDVYIEINASGARKGKRRLLNGSDEYYYPRSEFWEMTKKYPTIKIIIGSDAHHPLALKGKGMENAIDFIKKLDLKICPNNKIKF